MSAQTQKVETLDDLLERSKRWHMREIAHFNGGSVFFAYLYKCLEQPRLERFDRYDKKTRSVTSTWQVDGLDQESFEQALSALIGGAP